MKLSSEAKIKEEIDELEVAEGDSEYYDQMKINTKISDTSLLSLWILEVRGLVYGEAEKNEKRNKMCLKPPANKSNSRPLELFIR